MKTHTMLCVARAAGLALMSLFVVLALKGDVRAEEATGEYRPSALMLVEGKARDRIVANKVFYLVTRETEVFDATGKKLSLAALPVPCRAKVRYLPARLGLMPEAETIVVTEVLEGATTGWKMPAPE